MARNRIIKPDFWADEKIGQLNRNVRLMYIAMWNFCDDVGVVRSNMAYLKANIFPYDEDISVKDVALFAKELSNNELIISSEFNNECFFLLKNFTKHQKIDRPSAFRFVENTNKHNVLEIFNSSSTSTLLEAHSLPNENVEENVEEKEKEKEKVHAHDVCNFDFEQVYKNYPNKKGKAKGMKKIKGQIKNQEQFKSFTKALNNYAKLSQGKEKKYIQHFSTFVGNWEDYIEIDESEIPKSYDELMSEFFDYYSIEESE